MTSERSLVIPENETYFSKKIKLEHNLISVTINSKHPEIDIDDHEIQKFLLIFNLLLEAELNKEKVEDSEDGIPDILITIATKLLELLQNNIDSLKLPKIIKGALRKLKSFIVKDKKDDENKNDCENSARSEKSSSEGERKSEASSRS